MPPKSLSSCLDALGLDPALTASTLKLLKAGGIASLADLADLSAEDFEALDISETVAAQLPAHAQRWADPDFQPTGPTKKVAASFGGIHEQLAKSLATGAAPPPAERPASAEAAAPAVEHAVLRKPAPPKRRPRSAEAPPSAGSTDETAALERCEALEQDVERLRREHADQQAASAEAQRAASSSDSPAVPPPKPADAAAPRGSARAKARAEQARMADALFDAPEPAAARAAPPRKEPAAADAPRRQAAPPDEPPPPPRLPIGVAVSIAVVVVALAAGWWLRRGEASGPAGVSTASSSVASIDLMENSTLPQNLTDNLTENLTGNVPTGLAPGG